MLNFYRIKTVTDPQFSKLYDLYSAAFPPLERRSRVRLEEELMNEKRFNVHALLQDGQFVGFFNYWIFDQFYYIEHFAVNSNSRGQHIGHEAMEIFKQQAKLPIVFEVEMPNDPKVEKRIQFYEHLGFNALSEYYMQPSYDGDGFLLPMLILTNDVDFANANFEMIKETLYTQVYHYEGAIDK